MALTHRVQQFGIAVLPRPTCSVLRAPLHRQAASSVWDRHKLSVSWYPYPICNESKPYRVYSLRSYCHVSLGWRGRWGCAPTGISASRKLRPLPGLARGDQVATQSHMISETWQAVFIHTTRQVSLHAFDIFWDENSVIVGLLYSMYR